MHEATNQAINAQVSQIKLTELQRNFVTLLVMYYGSEGKLIPKEVAVEKYYIPASAYDQLIKMPEIHEAIKEWDIDIDALLERRQFEHSVASESKPAPIKGQIVSPLQMLVVNSLLNLSDPKSERKKLDQLQVSLKTYDQWKRDPVFMEYFKKRTEQMFGDAIAEANIVLIDRMRAGDIRAVKLYYELEGRLDKADTNVTVNSNVDVNILNFEATMIQIVEVINEEVKDPQVKAAISDRLKSLISGQPPVGNVINGELVKPEVASARIITPELEQLLESGAGVNV
jgi:hypothetical protein